MVLFCFSDVYTLPLTRSSYTPPEDKIDMNMKEEFIIIENAARKESFSINMGLPANTSAGFDFSLIHYDLFKKGDSRPGDILVNLWHYTGNFFDDTLGTGLSVVVRIPTGPDAYTDEKCRNLSFGNNELKITPVLSLRATGSEMLVLNLSYIFREGRGENFYGGFNVNPVKPETYKSFFGLNPFYENSFLNSERLKNDYASISAGLITTRLLPFVLFAEVYYSSGVNRKDKSLNELHIEGSGVNPLLLSAGIKFLFSDSSFLQFAETVDILKNEGFIKNTTEISLNIFF